MNWQTLLNGTTTFIGRGFIVLTVAVIVYIGAAVAVALFHPDQLRRADARAVLYCLIHIFKRHQK